MGMTWSFSFVECWLSWWQRCRRWRWTRRSLAASGQSSSSIPMSRDSKRFQGTHCTSFGHRCAFVFFLVPLLSFSFSWCSFCFNNFLILSLMSSNFGFIFFLTSTNFTRVEQLRERVYASLEEYTRWVKIASCVPKVEVCQLIFDIMMSSVVVFKTVNQSLWTNCRDCEENICQDDQREWDG